MDKCLKCGDIGREVRKLIDGVDRLTSRLITAEELAMACVAFDCIQPLPIAIAEPMHRWAEAKAASDKQEASES